MNELSKKFEKLVIKLQNLDKDWIYGYNMPKKNMDKIDAIGQEIFNGELIQENENITWAKQLLIKNNVPNKYWDINYYALWDNQCGRYMCSGLNSTSKEELKTALIGYLSADKSAEELDILETHTVEEIASMYEFTIEKSEKKFQEEGETV